MGLRITNLAAMIDLCEQFQESMYRLETLQTYDVAYERAQYAAFLAGEAIDLTPGRWQASVGRHRSAGRAVDRVHVAVEPLTDYLRYELATSYRRNVAAGERIGIIPATPGRWPTGVPAWDYWLFDDQHLWIMRYDHQGQFVEAEHRTDPTEIRSAVVGKQVALTTAIPFDDYLKTRNPALRSVS
jgi:hypothetical protein